MLYPARGCHRYLWQLGIRYRVQVDITRRRWAAGCHLLLGTVFALAGCRAEAESPSTADPPTKPVSLPTPAPTVRTSPAAPPSEPTDTTVQPAPAPTPPQDPRTKHLSVPEGFAITVWADHVARARSLARGDAGTVFVGTRTDSEGRVHALQDLDGDHQADTQFVIDRGLNRPNGVAFHKGALYVAEVSRLLRYDGIETRLDDPPEPVVVTDTWPTDAMHGWKFIRQGPDGGLYVPVGAPCNICLKTDKRYASILRMGFDGTNQRVIAHGVRNTVGFDWHPVTGELWFTDNGRDNISRDPAINDGSPPDELNRLRQVGQHFGYPFCHGGIVSDPEFGKQRPCSDFVP
ncbi:MAG: glucose/arabinose dehydrogenase, partial [Myxococcota bacterium]